MWAPSQKPKGRAVAAATPPLLTRRQFGARAKLRHVSVRLATDDIATARALAAEKGIGYQTYIKLLLRESLRRESGGR